ncbi:TonB-dependent receptor domain-containing protein [Granulicella tundricola]|uniref:Cna B-type protein n=1 Tax=Granulicella tundricola (strain ATCC BAA-1859 / DSM 23138 / MP5ACTX9) TaxID=1198114 RepID=E8WVY6_GRATM|nr:TonB-dependent receptor [Granulicella tundricola]ADW70745.1 Cna B-type protein [Granulicella tundricola MP5ACTX9]
MKKVLGLLAVSLVCTAMGLGQSQNGNVAGTVTDPSGAVVAGATVTVINVATGATRTTVTTGAGAYNIEGLPPQDYKVTVTAPGFGTTSTNTFNISVGSSNTVNAKLSVDATNVQVEVAANSLAGINLENAENSQVVNTQQLLELPTEGRTPYAFVVLSGNAAADPSATSRGVGVNLGGARSASTEILLDGIENTSLFSVGVATFVPVDSVQEYRIVTSNYGPEYGRASGGVVNVITKAGTNAFHGTAYEFFRPSTFASNSYYNNANAIPQHRFDRNNFGFAVGGPIVHDKLFFFNNTEWTRVRSSNVTQFYIPTSQFIAASASSTQAFFQQFGTVSGTPTGKILTLGQIGGAAGSVSSAFATDRAALELAKPGTFNDSTPILQQVNVTVPADAGGGVPQNTYNIVGRLDFNLSDRTQMYGRYVLYNSVTPSGTGNVSPYAGYSTGTTTKSQNLVYGITHTFSNSLVGQFQIGLLRFNNNQPLGTNPAGPTLFVSSAAAPSIANNSLVFPGYSEGNAANGLPSGGPQNNIVLSPTFTYTKGRHSITFGGQYSYIRDNHTFAIYENAQESLVSSTGTTDTINGVKVGALTNFVNGVTDYFQANLNPQGKFPCTKDLITGLQNVTAACTLTTPIAQPNFSRSNRYQEGAGFVNDSWKATPRLTINAGLRYELYGTQHNKNSALDSNFYFGTTGSLQDRVRAGKILQVNQAAPAGVQNPGGKLWNTNYKQFAPRVAFAYDLTGDGKTSLRGGYGISYERNFGNVTYNVALNPPSQLAISFTNLDVGAQIPISTGVLGSFSSGSGVSKAIPQGTVRAVDPRIKPAYNQFYTLVLERQINNTFAAGLAYTGERGIHNYSIANYNRSYYGQVYEGDAAKYAPSGAVNTNRLNPQFTSINVRGADGDSYFNSMNANLRGTNLYKTGVSLTANYTYAHSTDNTSSTFTDGQSNGDVGGVAYFDPYNHAIDHGNSDFDLKHRIAVGFVWQIPSYGATGYKRAALGGWEIGSIFTAATGTPFSMYDCALPAVTACPRARFLQTPNYQRVRPSIGGGAPDKFDYIDFPARYLASGALNNAAYGSYVDPKIGAADLPTIVNGMDTFPGGMSARNAFRGPGTISFNADVNKSIKFTERYSLQLRAELYNVLNHANAYLNLSGANDVSQNSFISTYKNGPDQGANRQLQLAAKIIF